MARPREVDRSRCAQELNRPREHGASGVVVQWPPRASQGPPQRLIAAAWNSAAQMQVGGPETGTGRALQPYEAYMSAAAMPNCQVRHERWLTDPVRDAILLCPRASARRGGPTG